MLQTTSQETQISNLLNKAGKLLYVRQKARQIK